MRSILTCPVALKSYLRLLLVEYSPQSWANDSKRINTYLKVVLDLVLTIFLLICLFPVMAIISLWVLRDGGPILFSHKRIGKNGRQFYCLKFRTMMVKSDSVLFNHLAQNAAARLEWQLTQKLANDPRVTNAGRFLRATSLDELPQLFNVVKLEMSLVGPRPIVESEIDRYGKHIKYYLKCRPGVTGLWQVSGRSNTTYNRRVAIDQWYTKNWRLWRDFAILFKTLPVVLLRNGAR